ncbi:SGNH/GDSL hydrolase family protein [Microbacterium capsulatum]|uniref:SGNH/GDSL hydrolase family protein n=1 Tax=Microbacterium capsulatum TaxID=3041921 RepID=A0ABU0XD24_9MICO|nr:SGNH/GDSL hydrolase family protein [Microbacterium sp. ASV81]MDQ4212614.1 SGNH/GDSL hydrolase family protein [Microbacterium sp. ASV81]
MSPIRVPRRRRLLALAAAGLALLALPLGAVSAAAAQPQSVARYVALGDSYAAGQGSGSYLDGCYRSTLGYPALLGGMPRLNLLREPACSGATIGQVAATQLTQINRGTTLVTITAGANDLDLNQVYAACAADGTAPACGQALAAAQGRIPGVGPAMAGLIAAVRAQAPQATIVVTGYPRPYADAYAAAVPLAGIVNQGTDALDAQLAGAVQAQPGAGTSVRFAGVSFGENAIGGSGAPWLGADATDPVDFLHPTAAGSVAYSLAVLAALN